MWKTIKTSTCFLVVIISQEGLWRCVVRLPCYWSYPKEHWNVFGLFVKKIKRTQNHYVLENLMKGFMMSQKLPFNLQLFFFTSWFQILGVSLFDGLEVLVKHIDMHLKIYSLDFNGWLMIPYTVSPNYLTWSFKNGPTIWLWKFDDQDCLKLLDGVSKPIWFHPIWGNDVSKLIEEEDFINSGMQWLDIDFITFSFHVRKNTNTNNTTTISDVYDNWVKTNIDVVNEVNHI